MTPATTFAGKPVALFGLGGSGLATALALVQGGAEVVACDDNPAKMAEAEKKGISTGDLRTADWSRLVALVLSPGVPLTHPEPHWSAKLAKEAGIEIIGDIELFCREREKVAPDAPFIAVTGTNGKSTTTALIAHILRNAGKDVQMGGNIGTAILSLEPPKRDRWHVIEMSSFQIDLAPGVRPSVGILLNISPDHLDRHGAMENYAAIKERLIAKSGTAVIGTDDEMTLRMLERLESRSRAVLAIGQDSLPIPGVSILGGGLRAELDGRVSAFDLTGIRSLRGDHNAQNAAAAVAVALLSGIEDEVIQSGLRSFPGLPHRMEEVGRRGRAIFVNDSKATNADSTEKALASFDRIYWILGGKAKEGGIAPLKPYFRKIEKAYLIGAATDEFAATLDGEVPLVRCGTLDNAVAQAAEDVEAAATTEPVVLLSPACASYDQYPNFEVRGDRFRDLVRALPGLEPSNLTTGE
jgi:UDP-N-acetylmuramoylalanine--D-glutamate ligase